MAYFEPLTLTAAAWQRLDQIAAELGHTDNEGNPDLWSLVVALGEGRYALRGRTYALPEDYLRKPPDAVERAIPYEAWDVLRFFAASLGYVHANDRANVAAFLMTLHNGVREVIPDDGTLHLPQ